MSFSWKYYPSPQEKTPESLLVVSDLHLGEGTDPETGIADARDDFRYDQEFAAFLRHYLQDTKHVWKLIINGDFIDFIQILGGKKVPGDLKGAGNRYGLDCGPKETVWKLQQVAMGHKVFFQALAEFALQRQVVLIRGNHDVEFTYPEVQDAFFRILSGFVLNHVPGGEDAETILRDHVRFADWFYLEPGRVYIEHGNQYEEHNSFRFVLEPLLPSADAGEGSTAEVEPPLGSLFVRYFFNRIETEVPYSDNIKPAIHFFQWYSRRYPVKTLSFLVREGIGLVSHIQRMARLIWAHQFLHRKKKHERKREDLAVQTGIPLEVLRMLDEERVQPTLYRPVGTWEILLRLFRFQLAQPLLLLWLVCTLGLFSSLTVLTLGAAGWLLVHMLGWTWFLWVPEKWFWLVMALQAGILLPFGFGLGWALHQIAGPDTVIQTLREKARRISRLMSVPLVVMGHTHTAEEIQAEEEKSAYINTGTWTRIFDVSRSRPSGPAWHYLTVTREWDSVDPSCILQQAQLSDWHSVFTRRPSSQGNGQ